MAVFQDHQLNNVLQTGSTWKVGSGDKIKFWEDCWSSDGVALMLKYPRLYQISRQQHKLIQHMGSFSETIWEWNFSWRRPLFDNEVDSAVEFMREISQVVIQQQVPDFWVWKHEPNGHYSTRSACKLLQGDSEDENQDGALHDLWMLKIPAKVSFFA